MPILDEVAYKFRKGIDNIEPFGSRQIQIRGVSLEVSPPSQLPFEGSTLKWSGQKAITTS